MLQNIPFHIFENLQLQSYKQQETTFSLCEGKSDDNHFLKKIIFKNAFGERCGSVVRLYYANLEPAVFSHLITTGEGRFDCIMYI